MQGSENQPNEAGVPLPVTFGASLGARREPSRVARPEII